MRCHSPVTLRNHAQASDQGDLQGLSNVESADSASVDELIEEGNTLETGPRREGSAPPARFPRMTLRGEYLDKE